MNLNKLFFFLNKINNIILNIEFEIKNNILNKKYINILNKKYIYFKYIYNILNDLNDVYNNIIFLKNEIDNNTDIKELALEEIKIFNKLKDSLIFKLSNFIYYKNEKIIDDNNEIIGCFLEIRSGTGGDEASLFSEILFKMYTKYISRYFNNISIINKIINTYGGIKEVIIKINNVTAFEKLKFESGGHRVQRIPFNESKGKIHTSTCTVGVIPIFKKYNNIINIKDLRIDTFRSSGAGGQHVNTTNSAIRIVHIPTNITIECQDERSQHQNKEKAMEILKYKLKILEINNERNKYSNIRKKLLGTGYRNDRIRTYNFVKNRIIDHRLLIKFNNIDNILDGNLDLLINNINLKYILNNINSIIDSNVL
ncbi:PCRF domain-containing protein [Candidatus Nardonella dryophthoridicola]|uniref:PCRF domain-containing protein n=1 Tax=Candidatus Nardonella dryophthoridicola TaxID=1971485 RepID=UPI001F1666A3|nr:PCRF domain-containing protein [Candidatus Nardonella dryophthoridicola]